MMLYRNFVLYIFAFIFTFFVTTKSLIPNAGFALIAMVWIFYNVFLLIGKKYYFKDHLPVIIFLVYVTLVYFFNIDEKFSTPAYIHISGSIFFYLVLVNLIDDFNVLSKMLLIHIIVVIPILSFMAYYSWFYWNSLWLTPDFETGSRFGKNTIGMFSVFCFIYLYGYFRNNRSLLVIIGLIIIGFCALYTISRGTLISLSLSIILFFIISNKKRFYIKPILILILAYFIIKNVFHFNYIENMLAVKSSGGEHIQRSFIDFRSDGPASRYGYGQRAAHYITIARKFPNRPIFGHGTESFRRNEGTLAHNDYITILYEYGLVGFTIFIYLIFSHLYNLFKVRNLIPHNNRWILEAQIVQVFIMMFTFLIMTTYISPMTWYILAISAVIPKIIKKHYNNGTIQFQ